MARRRGMAGLAREDADWNLKMEGLRGMLPPARLAESRGPDGRLKDSGKNSRIDSKFPKTSFLLEKNDETYGGQAVCFRPAGAVGLRHSVQPRAPHRAR